MTMLNGLLAFAVTMIVLSTVVAAVVEFLQELRRKREYYMRGYLLSFFDTHIAPRFHHEIAALAKQHAKTIEQGAALAERARASVTPEAAPIYAATADWFNRNAIATRLMIVAVALALLVWINSLALTAVALALAMFVADRWWQERKLDGGMPGDGSDATNAALQSFRAKFIADIARISDAGASRATYVTRLKPTEFASALGRTEAGEMIVQAGRDKLDLLVTDLLRRFDDSGTASVEEFKKQARTLSIMVAFLVAFVVNINAVTLIEAYFRDDSLATRVANQFSEEQLATMAGTLEAVQADAEAQRQQQREETPATPEALAALEEQATALVDEVNTIVAELTAAAVPIGWRFYPYCIADRAPAAPGCEEMNRLATLVEAAAAADRCALAGATGLHRRMLEYCTYVSGAWDWLIERQTGFAEWLVGVLAAGALVGLGGPFWFDVYRRLSAVTQVAQRLGVTGTGKGAEKANAPEEAANPETVHAPASALEAFKEAAAAHAITSGGQSSRALSAPPSRRRLLNDDGT